MKLWLIPWLMSFLSLILFLSLKRSFFRHNNIHMSLYWAIKSVFPESHFSESCQFGVCTRIVPVNVHNEACPGNRAPLVSSFVLEEISCQILTSNEKLLDGEKFLCIESPPDECHRRGNVCISCTGAQLYRRVCIGYSLYKSTDATVLHYNNLFKH